MKTYRERKEEILKQNPDLAKGMEITEKLIEEQIRENLTPISVLVQQLSTLLDTKKERKKEEILTWLKMNPNLLEAKNNIEVLRNICRL